MDLPHFVIKAMYQQLRRDGNHFLLQELTERPQIQDFVIKMESVMFLLGRTDDYENIRVEGD